MEKEEREQKLNSLQKTIVGTLTVGLIYVFTNLGVQGYVVGASEYVKRNNPEFPAQVNYSDSRSLINPWILIRNNKELLREYKRLKDNEGWRVSIPTSG